MSRWITAARPCLLDNSIGLLIGHSAKALGISVAEPISRLVAAWMEAACGFDGLSRFRVVPPA